MKNRNKNKTIFEDETLMHKVWVNRKRGSVLPTDWRIQASMLAVFKKG